MWTQTLNKLTTESITNYELPFFFKMVLFFTFSTDPREVLKTIGEHTAILQNNSH